MKTSFWRAVTGIGLALVVASPTMAADPFPTRPIRILVNTGPGGLVDVTTRVVGQYLSEVLKQPVVVENRAGGDGLIGIRAAKAAPADGYTLLASASTIALQLAVKAEPGYELKDFTGIGVMGRSPFLLVEAPDKPDKTLADFIARAKANPNKLSYASAGVGTTTHLGAALFVQQAGVQIVHVPYKGNGPAMPDVLSGRVDMIFEAYGSSGAKIKGGTLKALGVTSGRRLPALPGVPTFAEQGVPNFTFYTVMYLVAPARTPKEVVQQLSEALRTALSNKALVDRFREDGVEAVDASPQQTNELMAREASVAAKLAADLGMSKE
jgi:tripartite-type tricarboxylate transporter receptor subunit TctC